MQDVAMPTYDDLVRWAGVENVARAEPATVARWQVPARHSLLLAEVGVPAAPQLIEYAAIQPEEAPRLATDDGRLLYQLTGNHHGNLVPGLLWAFGVEPNTGTVYYVLPGGEPWYANADIDLWLNCLHHYGRSLHESNIYERGDEMEEQEEGSALAYFHQLAAEVRQIDPSAFAGNSSHLIWPEILELWYW
jgi:hypothetical protein